MTELGRILLLLAVDYIRSYRYFASYLIYVVIVPILYTYKPNPVLSSYAISSAILFVVAAWLGFGYVRNEDETQEQVTYLHVQSPIFYYISKIMFLWLVSFPLALYAIVYPIVFQMFDRPVTAGDLLTALSSHAGLGLLGIAVALLLHPRLIAKTSTAVSYLFLIMIVSLAQKGIMDAWLPRAFQAAGLLIPPVGSMMHALNSESTLTSGTFVLIMISPFVYALIVCAFYVKRMRDKLF